MGKSTVANMFRRLGVPVFDADAEVHRLQGPGGELVASIEAAFPGTTGPGGVDRQALGKWVLGNAVELNRLQALVHPAVYLAPHMFLRRPWFLPLSFGIASCRYLVCLFFYISFVLLSFILLFFFFLFFF